MNDTSGNGLAEKTDKPMKTMLDLFEVRNERPLTPSDRPPASESQERSDDIVTPTPSNRRLWSSEELS